MDVLAVSDHGTYVQIDPRIRHISAPATAWIREKSGMNR